MATDCFGSRYFMSWLAEQQISLAFSAYQAGDVFVIGPTAEKSITVGRARYTRAMGIALSGNSLYLGTAAQIWLFDRVTCQYPGFTSAFLPRVGVSTGDIDVHEMAVEDSGRLVFVNTLHSCLATLSNTESFSVVWKPPFISKLAPEDRCHLNGLALRDGVARYVTMAANSDVMGQWRAQMQDGGMVMDITTNEVIAEGLSMPHSPRWHEERLWLHNSGTGEFGYINNGGTFESVCFCPGYLRGLSFVGRYAVVGLSRMRARNKEANVRNMPLEKLLEEKKLEARCGIYIINMESGNIDHALNIEGDVTELFDVKVLSGITQTDILEFDCDQVKQLVNFTHPV
jgi:uncharacterized protein (TIGR03032 family)